MSSKIRLEALRKLMAKNNIDAWIVPSADPHQSEYVAPRWKAREWISGFTGSAGTVVITKNKAGLWTDSRYFLQADQQLKGSTISLFKMGEPGVPSYAEWLCSELKKGMNAGFDASVMSISSAKGLKKALEKKGVAVQYAGDLINELWKDRPQIPMNKLALHELKYAGEKRIDKLNRIREKMKEKNADCLILSALDDIAWTFNIRGSDVLFNPVVISYAMIMEKKAVLFIKNEKLNAAAKQSMAKDGVDLEDYDNIQKYIKNLKKKTIILDADRTSQHILNAIDPSCKVIEEMNIPTRFKALKNKAEIEGMKQALVTDGVAMVRFLAWLDQHIGKTKITEMSAGEKLEEFRKAGDGFVGLSFETIAGYGEHGAIIHYGSTPETDVELKKQGIFLLDSGAQYPGGTTDITRTMTLGRPTSEQKKTYTLVLKGHIDLAMAKFPSTATGMHLDAFARAALWHNGLNYAHGTGHGIGAFLNVHEGPMSISPRINDTKLEPGMIMSNEPGFYKAGEYGIRIENLVLVVELEKTNYGTFLGFETITLCSIDLRLVEPSLLCEKERKWLNDYHKEVYKKLSPYINKEEKAWLKENTAEI